MLVARGGPGVLDLGKRFSQRSTGGSSVTATQDAHGSRSMGPARCGIVPQESNPARALPITLGNLPYDKTENVILGILGCSREQMREPLGATARFFSDAGSHVVICQSNLRSS